LANFGDKTLHGLLIKGISDCEELHQQLLLKLFRVTVQHLNKTVQLLNRQYVTLFISLSKMRDTFSRNYERLAQLLLIVMLLMNLAI
jgi:hypothetical protein